MNIEFTSNKITYEIDSNEEYYMIGFSDNGDNPNQYIIIQRSFNFDDQDVKCGMDTYYFEYSDQSNSGYGICKKVKLMGNSVVFDFDDKKLNSISSIRILFEKNIIDDWSQFKDIFNRIFLLS